MRLEELPAETLRYIQENPGQTLFYVVNGVVLYSPGLVYGPILDALGWGAVGVRGHSVAARSQQMFGGAVPAGSWFSRMTSSGAGGTQGAAMLNGLTRLGSLVACGVKPRFDILKNVSVPRAEL